MCKEIKAITEEYDLNMQIPSEVWGGLKDAVETDSGKLEISKMIVSIEVKRRALDTDYEKLGRLVIAMTSKEIKETAIRTIENFGE